MRYLLTRLGAFGDNIILTPVIRKLKLQGHSVVVLTSERGMQVFKNNPNIEKLIEQKTDEIKIENLESHFEWVKKKNKCDKHIDFSESIEVSLSQHPRGASYKLTKPERMALFNKNFYEHTMEWAGLEWTKEELKGELFFDVSEIESAKKHIKPGCFNVLIGLSGSGTNKCWPHIMDFCNETYKLHPNVHFITVGDVKCQLLEDSMDEGITKLSGNISMRESMALTGLVDLVICPDTGIAHAAGTFDTPIIVLLGHNTIECITKHFTNDYSIEADQTLAPCSPCLFLIYNMKLQCPLNPVTNSSICMADGIPIQKVYDRFKEVYARPKKEE